MGNSQLSSSNNKQKYIKAKKIIETAEKQPMNDVSNQLEQIFGVSSLPVSHHVHLSKHPKKLLDLLNSEIFWDKNQRQGSQYQERIANLQNQIFYLKSVIEQMQDRSRGGSPIRSEVAQDEPSYNSSSETSRQINTTQSRMSQAYFQTREEFTYSRGQEEEQSEVAQESLERSL